MITQEQAVVHALMLIEMYEEGILSDEFLLPEEFLIVKSTPYPEWPHGLREKLAKWTHGWGKEYPKWPQNLNEKLAKWTTRQGNK